LIAGQEEILHRLQRLSMTEKGNILSYVYKLMTLCLGKESDMSYPRIIFLILTMVLALALPLQAETSKGKPVKPVNQWSGSVDDLSLMKMSPEFILSTQEFEKLWQAWKVAGPVPQVDFAKHLVLVDTTRGSILRFGATLDKKGNLQIVSMATKDLRPGFRYVIAVVSREEVKTVNGKKLAAATP
jgi:hypothetical protein